LASRPSFWSHPIKISTQVAGNVPDKKCIFIVQEKQEFFGGPVKGWLSPQAD
jgi:hypothetical protein